MAVQKVTKKGRVQTKRASPQLLYGYFLLFLFSVFIINGIIIFNPPRWLSIQKQDGTITPNYGAIWGFSIGLSTGYILLIILISWFVNKKF